MKIESILIYGSTKLTEACCHSLENESCVKIIGYIANKREPTVPGDMSRWKQLHELPKHDAYDIAVCIQYDCIIADTSKIFNLHTGLLPEYGGVDVLYHTLRNCAPEQGLTFHKMEPALDEGGILSKATYPVFTGDNVLGLYARMLRIAPSFCTGCIELLRELTAEQVARCRSVPPQRYRRGKEINECDLQEYLTIPQRLRDKFC